MKKLGILVMAMVLVCGLSLGAFALDNPWEGDGAEVDVTLSVDEMGEVWSALGTGQARDEDDPVVLEIDNSAGILPSDGSGVAEDTLNHFANVDYEVMVDIDGTIPDYARFHVILNPSNDGYDEVNSGAGTTTPGAEKIITFTGEQTENNDVETLLSNGASSTANQTPVDYAMDAISGIPDEGDQDIDVIYTIAAQ